MPANTVPRPVWGALDLGLVPYGTAHELQLGLLEARRAGRLATNLVLFMEHPQVFTLGRHARRTNLRVTEAFLALRGIPLIQVERGGDITYHGPGQLVVYTIVHLPSARLGVARFVEALEEAMLRTARAWGIPAARHPRQRGLWAADRKLGSVGIAVRRGITFHGLALNVSTDLEPFDWINPCGLAGTAMTSMARETGRPVNLPDVRAALTRHMAEVFGVTLEVMAPGDLEGLRILRGQDANPGG